MPPTLYFTSLVRPSPARGRTPPPARRRPRSCTARAPNASIYPGSDPWPVHAVGRTAPAVARRGGLPRHAGLGSTCCCARAMLSPRSAPPPASLRSSSAAATTTIAPNHCWIFCRNLCSWRPLICSLQTLQLLGVNISFFYHTELFSSLGLAFALRVGVASLVVRRIAELRHVNS